MYICAKILSEPSLQDCLNWFTLCNWFFCSRYQRHKHLIQSKLIQTTHKWMKLNVTCKHENWLRLEIQAYKKWRLLWAAQLNNYFLHVHFSQCAIKPHCKLQQTQSTYPTYTVNYFGARAFEVETKTIWENHLFTCQKVHILAILYSSSLDKSSDLIMSEARRTNNVKEMRKSNQRLRLIEYLITSRMPSPRSTTVSG